MAQRALMPSQIPGATCERIGVKPCTSGVFQDRITYNDTGSREHLAEARRRVDRERSLEEVLGIQAGIVVHTRTAWRGLDGGGKGDGRDLNHCGGGCGGLKTKEIESGHDCW